MKKIIAFFLSTVMLLGVVSGTVAAEHESGYHNLYPGLIKDKTFDLGDVNGDGSVNSVDFLYCRANLLALNGYDMVEDAADFDADGELSAKDAYYLKNCLVGLASPSDYGDDTMLHRLTIGGVDIKEFSIVLPEGTEKSENIYFSFELMRAYVQRAHGYELPLEFGSASTGHGIYYHKLSLSTDEGKALGEDGYRYTVENGNLHIYGANRGNMYATYEIIEDYLGYVFHGNYFVYEYKNRYVDIAEGTDKTFVPPLTQRHVVGNYWGYSSRTHYYLALGLNCTANYTYGTDSKRVPITYYGGLCGTAVLNAHSYYYYHAMGTGTMPDDSVGDLAERYYQKMLSGEQKSMLLWQPCATDDNQYKILFEGMLDTLEMYKARGYTFLYEEGQNYISFSLNDNKNWHDCRNCRAKANGNANRGIPAEGYSGLYCALANRAAVDIQKYYPGVKITTIIYEYDFPETFVPDENLILIYCGFGCNNHALGSDGCTALGAAGKNNIVDEQNLKGWIERCNQSGAELWFWYYPDTFNFFLYDLPNYFNIYYDVQWLYDLGVTGIYYEGSGECPGLSFEPLKNYVAARLLYEPEMSFDEYVEYMKEFLYITFGDGYELIYEVLCMYNEAGDKVGTELGNTYSTCFMATFDRAFDLVSIEYIQEHYEEMRELILQAKSENDLSNNYGSAGFTEINLNNLLCCIDFLGLSACYVDMYVNGDETSRALYEERYTDFYNYLVENNVKVFVDTVGGNIYGIPQTLDFSKNPMTQIYGIGSRRPEIQALLG